MTLKTASIGENFRRACGFFVEKGEKLWYTKKE